jgi:Ca-activated chloride channel family protein
MKTNLTIPAWMQILLLLALAVSVMPAAPARSVELDVQMSTPLILAGSPRKAYVRIALTGLDTGRHQRPPVNVAIVLDRSGSMLGRKIEAARRAAIAAIDRLRDDDIVSVVTYQNTVDVLVPATKLYDRESVRNAIRQIRSGGGTALFAGVSKGARELGNFLDRNRVNTLLLLSDGLANVGPSSPGELAELGVSLARQGISVTTIGLGLGYNEDLMTRLAMASDGNHFFVENEADLEAAFAAEFGDLLSVVAQNVTIHVHCPSGVRPIRTLGREARISGQDVYATLNQVYRDQTRYLLLEVEVPSAGAGKVQSIAEVSVGYHDLRSGSKVHLRGHASATYTVSPAAVERSSNRDVMVAVVGQVGAEQNKVATALRDAGKIEEAREAFRSNSAYLQKNAEKLDDSRLQVDALMNEDASEHLGDRDWSRERKKQVEAQYKTQQQRISIGKTKPLKK